MVVDHIITDQEFGKLYIKTNARAVRYTFRPAFDGGKGILITAPRLYALPDLMRAVEKMRPRLRVMLEKAEAIEQRKKEQLPLSAEQQAEKCRAIERMRALAKRTLPSKLMALAEEFGFKVEEVKINSAQSRWGSCVCRKKGFFSRKEYTINLSLFLILLPDHLQRFIMLHELTHIHHMDHSTAFHAELDAMLDGKEKALEAELKTFTKESEELRNFKYR